jgi:transcriptional regulator with XRE-family HTH domain
MVMESTALLADDETALVLLAIGRNIRRLRGEKALTLQMLAEQTGLSPSMLSLLERGKTGPSIGTLVVIASALGAQMSELMDQADPKDDGVVSRVADQPVFETGAGVLRRILKHDRAMGVEIAINEYAPGTANAPSAVSHDGHEFGVVLEGTIEVTLDEKVWVLTKGDVISYSSRQPHRFSNPADERAQTLWINLRLRE